MRSAVEHPRSATRVVPEDRTLVGVPPIEGADVDHEEDPMSGAAILVLILALLLGGVGLFVEALRWVLIIAVVLLLVSIFTGARGRRGPSSAPGRGV